MGGAFFRIIKGIKSTMACKEEGRGLIPNKLNQRNKGIVPWSVFDESKLLRLVILQMNFYHNVIEIVHKKNPILWW